MTDKPRLIDADKLLKWIEESPEAEGFWGEGEMTVQATQSFDNLDDAIALGKFDPDLPQQPDIQREYQQVAKGWNDDLTAAESLIQQKDAEIERLNKIIKDANDENERLLSGEGTEEYESALTELLKENTP
ncbi:hypothetical protein V2U94_04315 [Paenibacillus polymyxa]|uniref:hypothetical protein n=1 Tax=Paenibacillus polymyxa TaxID=1406 RepID=UPI002ED47EA0|nr:hypothetical protein [Paenibacillus polymyxa]